MVAPRPEGVAVFLDDAVDELPPALADVCELDGEPRVACLARKGAKGQGGSRVDTSDAVEVDYDPLRLGMRAELLDERLLEPRRAAEPEHSARTKVKVDSLSPARHFERELAPEMCRDRQPDGDDNRLVDARGKDEGQHKRRRRDAELWA
jgi:hypothetical protein